MTPLQTIIDSDKKQCLVLVGVYRRECKPFLEKAVSV